MRFGFVLLALLVLVGCAPPLGSAAVPGLAQLEAATVVASDKSIVDHVVSLASGKDCSVVRLEKGQRYCVEDEPLIKQNIHCYRTLGRVTCYTKPDPFKDGRQRVGENDHNMLPPKPVNAP